MKLEKKVILDRMKEIEKLEDREDKWTFKKEMIWIQEYMLGTNFGRGDFVELDER